MKFADLVNFKMLLDGTMCEKMCKAGDIENHIAPFQIGHDPSISIYKPYEYIYCRYVSLSFIQFPNNLTANFVSVILVPLLKQIFFNLLFNLYISRLFFIPLCSFISYHFFLIDQSFL